MKNSIKKFLAVVLTFSLAFPLGNNFCSADDSEQENMVSSKISVVWDKTKNTLNEAWNSAACNATKNALRIGWEFTEKKSGIYWNKLKYFCEKNWRWFNDEFMANHPLIAVVIISQVANVSIEAALSVVTLVLSPLFRNRRFRNLAEKINKLIGTKLITNLPTTEQLTGGFSRVTNSIGKLATTEQLKSRFTSVVSRLGKLATAQQLTNVADDINSLATTEQLTDGFSGVTNSINSLANTINSFVTKTDLSNAVSQLVTSQQLNTGLANLATSQQLDDGVGNLANTVNGLVTKDGLKDALTELTNTFTAKIAELDETIKKLADAVSAQPSAPIIPTDNN